MFVTIRTPNGVMFVDVKKFLDLKSLADLRKLLKIAGMENWERREEIKKKFVEACESLMDDCEHSGLHSRKIKYKRRLEEVLKFD